MTRLIRGEAIKLRTTRTAVGYAIAASLITLAIVLLTILAGHPKTIDDKRSALAVGASISALLLFFGIVGAGSEYRHRTLAPALLVAPHRARLLTARIGAYGVAGIAIGAIMLLVAFVLGLPLLAGRPGPDLGGGDYVHAVVGGLLASGLCAMLGVGAGTLISKQVPAVIGAMVWLFILEPLVDLVSHDATQYTIGQAANSLGGGTGGRLLPWGTAGLVLLGWTALFAVAAAFVDRRRDVD